MKLKNLSDIDQKETDNPKIGTKCFGYRPPPIFLAFFLRFIVLDIVKNTCSIPRLERHPLMPLRLLAIQNLIAQLQTTTQKTQKKPHQQTGTQTPHLSEPYANSLCIS